MSLTIQLYKWHKRVNSTKLPGVADPHTDFSCTLKEPTSIHNPVIILATNDCDFTYARISAWSRYYFVEDVVYVHNGLVEYHLVEDYLGSNKTNIGSTYAMIAYASNHYTLQAADSRLPALATKSAAGVADSDTLFKLGDAHYLLTVYNTLYTNFSGFACCYLLNDTALSFLRQWLGSGTVMDDLANFFNGQPMDAIFDLKWVPYSYGSTSTEVTDLWIGNQNSGVLPTGAKAYKIVNFPYLQRTTQLTRPFIYSDFRAWEPYTTGFVHLPGIGNVDIHLADWKSSKICIATSIEVITGNVTYMFFREDGALMQTATCNVASEVPIGQMVGQGGNILSSLGTAAAGVAAMGTGIVTESAALFAGGAAAAITGTLNTALNTNRHAPSIIGHMGGRNTLLWPYITMTEIAVDTEDPDNANWIATKGRPVGYVAQINTYSGYVQTIGASVSLDADKEEIETVNRMLDSGIYYE